MEAIGPWTKKEETCFSTTTVLQGCFN